jgi:hypothetical protein
MAKIQKLKANTPVPNLFDLPDNILVGDSRVFYPDWTNQPPPSEPIISIDNKRVLSQGGYMAIVSRAGAGKSSICEAIISQVINPQCDALGFQVSLTDNRYKCLYIDTERTPQDTWLSWERMMRRARVEKPEIDKRITFANLKAVALSERICYTEKLLKDNPEIGLVLFDGGSDFVMDVNDAQQIVKFSDWINSYNPLISEVITLHTNPTDNKPRGHLGSELLRRAESVLLLRKLDDKVREITTKFEFGKVRNDDDSIQTYYQWCASHNMFISTDYTPPKPVNQEREESNKKLAVEMFDGRTQVSWGYMLEFIANKKGITTGGAKKAVEKMIGIQIKKVDTNVWELV